MGSKYKHVFNQSESEVFSLKTLLKWLRLLPTLPVKMESNSEFVEMFRSFAAGSCAVIHIGNSVVDHRDAHDEERQRPGTDDAIALDAFCRNV